MGEGQRKGTKATDSAYIEQLIQTGHAWESVSLDSALLYYREAWQFSRQVGYYRTNSWILGKIAQVYRYRGDYDRAIYYFKRAVDTAEARRGKELLLVMYNNLSGVYYERGFLYQAVVVYYKALDLLRQYPELTATEPAVTLYSDMSTIWLDLDEDQKALACLDTAEQLARVRKDTVALVNIAVNRGRAYSGKNRALSLKYYQDALRYHASDLGKEMESYIWASIGRLMVDDNQVKEGMGFLDKALRQAKSLPGGQRYQLFAESFLAHAYYHIVEDKLAEQYLKSVIALAEKRKDLGILIDAYWLLEKVLAAQGKFREAYSQQLLLGKLSDSFYREGRRKTLDFVLDYQRLGKERELAQKQLYISRQRNVMQLQYFWIAVAGLCILVLFILMYRKRQRAALKRLRASLAGEEKERQRMARDLQEGIVSRLSMISLGLRDMTARYPALRRTGQFSSSVEQLDQAITELSATSHNQPPAILQATGLAESVRVYCEKISSVAGLQLRFQMMGILPALTEDFQLNIYRIVQEVINNMRKHSGATQGLVQFTVGQHLLEISIEDNGVSVAGGQWNTAYGIGLFNLQGRVILLNGSVRVERKQGTALYLEFDLRNFIQKTV